MAEAKDALLRRARAEVRTCKPSEVAEALGSARALVLDVREPDEVESGRIPGAAAVARGLLELRIEALAGPDTAIVTYCASGVRSILAAKTLMEMGYRSVQSLEGGIEAWKASGGRIEIPPSLSNEERQRYARQTRLPEVGEAGQLRLRSARVLIIGAGGLGSPAALYLAAAGVGTVGLVDDDQVDLSNLQRQILHRTADAGVPKVESAERALHALNPSTRVETFRARFDLSNASDILDRNWDVVIDGTDLIPPRYVINDACLEAKVPLVHGAIHRFEGQVAVFAPVLGGPCYRCLFPVPPPPEAVPSCAEAGVLGPLPGVIGSLQALEALKLILGFGAPLVGRLLRVDAAAGTFDSLVVPRDPGCSSCGSEVLASPRGALA